jgi:hypothetical protein
MPASGPAPQGLHPLDRHNIGSWDFDDDVVDGFVLVEGGNVVDDFLLVRRSTPSDPYLEQGSLVQPLEVGPVVGPVTASILIAGSGEF